VTLGDCSSATLRDLLLHSIRQVTLMGLCWLRKLVVLSEAGLITLAALMTVSFLGHSCAALGKTPGIL